MKKQPKIEQLRKKYHNKWAKEAGNCLSHAETTKLFKEYLKKLSKIT